MKIRAQDLEPGDVMTVHDWRLHVVRVERDRAVAVSTMEFDFLIHFLRDELVSVRKPLSTAA
jgi:hypothetical protein